MSSTIVQQLNNYLSHFNVVIKFIDPVIEEDLPNYNKGQITEIFAAILTRFENNGNPHELTEKWKLKRELRGYLKIRLLPQMIRIVYKVEEHPSVTNVTVMVIGPKKDEAAYKIAKKRIKKGY